MADTTSTPVDTDRSAGIETAFRIGFSQGFQAGFFRALVFVVFVGVVILAGSWFMDRRKCLT